MQVQQLVPFFLACRTCREMQGDDKRNDLFLGQGGPGAWDTRPSSEPREVGNVSAAWSNGTTLTQPSCRNPCERGMGAVEEIVWSGDDASVIHRSSSLGGQCASTGSSNSQPGPRHNRGTSAASSSSSWPSNDSTSEGADQLLGAVGGSEETSQSSSQPPQPSRNCRPPRLGLLGGGENSHNNGTTATTTGWGAPPPGPQGGWGSSGGAQWGGATARSADYTPGGPNPSGDAGGASSPTKPAAAGSWGQGAVSKSADAPDAKGASMGPRNVLEEPMTELRRMAAFSEGWGQTAINQDSPWELPQSPGTKEPPTGAPWRAPVNTGTEIWENNLRSARAGGSKQPNPPQAAQGSSQCPQQQPWGSHTPTSHIGGTWGEEDEVPSSNMWTGVPTPAQQGGPRPPSEGPPSWGGDHHRGGGDKHWGGPAPPPGSGWGGPEERESQGRLWGGRPSHAMDDGPSGAWGGGPKGGGPPPGVGTWSPVGGPNGKREPSGWEEPSPPPSRRPVTNYDDGTALWGNPTRQGKVGSAVSHWKDMPSVKSISGSGGGAPPGMLRMPKEGVWGGNKGPRGGGANWGDSGWEDHKGAWGGVPPEQAYWGSKPKGPPSWADGQIDTSTWGGPSKQGGKPLTKDLIYASKQFRLLTEMGFKKEDVENALRINQMNLEDTLMDLKALPRGNGTQDSGLLDGSDCGLGGVRPKMRPEEDPHGPLGEAPFAGFHAAAAGFQGLPVFGAGYGGGQGFKPPPVKGSNQVSNAPASLLNSTGMGGQNSSLTVGNSISSLSPALVQKILQQQQQQQQHFPGNAGCPGGMGARLGQPNVPSATQLRLLVQQIQMAVHAGHLNPQILNQPLAPQTLQLLYQLLQQIKVLHQLQQQQQLVHAKGGPPLQLNVQLTQTKQRILNLQNQIAAQQALFLKQQLPPPQQPPQQQAPPHAAPPPPAGMGGGPSTPQEFLGGKPGGAEGLHPDFRDLSLKDPVSQQQQQQQSRLNQWKLPPSLDDENKAPQQNGGGDFSRAPGPASKAGSGLPSFLGGTDGPWSTGACSQDGWPDAPPTTSGASGGTSSPGEAKDSNAAGYSLSDLVAEFEPGKPWKGASALKSAEDDPHLTPGSVVRSPLSVNTIKDSELFGSWKQSPPGGEGSLVASLASLTSSTWAFTPAMHGSGNGGAGSSKGNASKSSWGGSSEQAPSSDPWNVGPKTRGPPPGLSASGWDHQGSSSCTFLVLKNLTPQIDGSTLKTLCMQHGPLQLFHLFLKHGLALAQYGSREEAAKAQSALHNCVLSNTTMLAYIPSESEVAQFLQLANGQGQHPSQQPPPPQHQMPWGSSSAAFHPPQRPPLQQYAPGRPGKQPAEPWNTPQPPASSAAAAVSSSSNASHLWSFPGAGGGLWAAPQTSQAGGGGSNPTGLDHDHGAPGGPQSSLNSFLPGDLLSGESM